MKASIRILLSFLICTCLLLSSTRSGTLNTQSVRTEKGGSADEIALSTEGIRTAGWEEQNSQAPRDDSGRAIQGGSESMHISTVNPASFTRHLMCKDHDIFYNPVEPTTTFRPSDKKAECLTTVSINNSIEFKWYYRSNSSKTWVFCYNWTAQAQIGEYYYAGYLLIAGYWPEMYCPKAYKVDVYLDRLYSFSEFFEVTNGGPSSPRTCENVETNGSVINMKSRFTIGADAKAYYYFKFDKMAYFNEETKHSHNYTSIWVQPDGTTYKTHSCNFNDYKDNDTNLDYWRYGMFPDDYIDIDSNTPVGNWKIELFTDSYYVNNTWSSYGPIATTPFIVGNETVSDWTFMVYLDGDNNLVNQSIDVFLKLATVNSSALVNVLVQMDRAPDQNETYGNWTDTKRFKITEGTTPNPENALENLTETDMGDPNTLKDFLNWAITNYPANRYFLALWNHGAGCMGLCFDKTSANDNLTLPELTQALKGLPTIIDDILIDACSMSMAEVAYQIRDFANILIGPEGLGWSPGPYDDYLTSLTGDPAISPNAFADAVTFDFLHWSYPAIDIPNATMFATDLNKIDDLATAVDDFVATLKEKQNLYHQQIDLARNLSTGYSGPFEIAGKPQIGYYIDLHSFAQQIREGISLDSKLRNAAIQTMNAINNAVISRQTKNDPESQGLAIFFPDSRAKYDEFADQYEKTGLAINTQWTSFLKNHLSTWCTLNIQTPHAGISANVDQEVYTANSQGKIRVFLSQGPHNVTVPSNFSSSPDSREVFMQWNDTDKSNPRALFINNELNLQAEYVIEYRVVIRSNFGRTNPPTGEYWLSANSTLEISAVSPGTVAGERYVWIWWIQRGPRNLNIAENSTQIAIDGPLNETAVMKHEYYLQITSEHGTPIPVDQWFEAGTIINSSVTSPASGTSGARYICTGWTGTGSVSANGNTSTTTFTLNSPSAIQWNWKTQYLLTVRTEPIGLSPQPKVSPETTWCDEYTIATCTAQQVNAYVFQYWTVDSATWDIGVNPITFVMDKTYEVLAHYVRAQAWWEILVRPDILQAMLALLGTSLTVGLLGGAWLRSRRRRNILKTFLTEIDDVYSRFSNDSQKCEEELYRLRNTILEGFTEGRITEDNYEIMDRRIDKYMKELARPGNRSKANSDNVDKQ